MEYKDCDENIPLEQLKKLAEAYKVALAEHEKNETEITSKHYAALINNLNKAKMYYKKFKEFDKEHSDIFDYAITETNKVLQTNVLTQCFCRNNDCYGLPYYKNYYSCFYDYCCCEREITRILVGLSRCGCGYEFYPLLNQRFVLFSDLCLGMLRRNLF